MGIGMGIGIRIEMRIGMRLFNFRRDCWRKVNICLVLIEFR